MMRHKITLLLTGILVLSGAFLAGNVLGWGDSIQESSGSIQAKSVDPEANTLSDQEESPTTQATSSVSPTASPGEPIACPDPPFQRRPLVGATATEVGHYAIHYTCKNYPVLTGVPIVRLSTSVTSATLPSFGLDALNFIAEEPPLMLVILQGDFDVRGMPGGARGPLPWHWRVGFIAYVFHLRVGMPTLTMTSVQGGRFRTALNDPSLPDDPPAVTPDLRAPTREVIIVPTFPPILTPRPVTPAPTLTPWPTRIPATPGPLSPYPYPPKP